MRALRLRSLGGRAKQRSAKTNPASDRGSISRIRVPLHSWFIRKTIRRRRQKCRMCGQYRNGEFFISDLVNENKWGVRGIYHRKLFLSFWSEFGKKECSAWLGGHSDWKEPVIYPVLANGFLSASLRQRNGLESALLKGKPTSMFIHVFIKYLLSIY